MSSLASRVRSTFWGRLALVAALGLAVRVTYVLTVERESRVGGDALYYHEAAKLLADGKGFIDPYRYLFGGSEEVTFADGTIHTVVTPKGHVAPTAGHPPVYVVFLGAVSKLGLRTTLEHKLASAVLGTVSVVLSGLVGRELGGERLGLVTATITAVYAFIWVNDGLVMSETAAIVMAFLASWVALRFARAPTVRGAALFGVVGALAALTRAELVLFLPIVAAAVLWRARLSWSARIGRYAVAGGCCVVVLAPWVVRNLRVFEEPVYLSDGAGTVLVQANCDSTYYGPEIGYWDISCGYPTPYGPSGELLDESQRDVVVRERATEYIKDHKTRLLTVVVPRRVGRMWSLYRPIQQLRLDVLSDARKFRVSMIGLAQYAVLAPSAVAGAFILWRRRLPVLPVGLWAVLVTFTAASAFGNIRYRTAAEVSIVVLAAVTFDALWRRWRPA